MTLEEFGKRLNKTVWNSYGRERVYFEANKKNTKCWVEVVNDKLELFVESRNENIHKNSNLAQAKILKAELENQLHELLHDCELERTKVAVEERLKDKTPLSSDFKTKPFAHQLSALDVLLSMKVGAAFMDVGTGKSLVAIELATARFRAGKIKKVVILTPVSTKLNFERQIEEHSPIETTVYTADSKTNRTTTIATKSGTLTWIIAGTESIQQKNGAGRVFDFLKQITDNDTMLIVDESHLIKGKDSNRALNAVALSKQCSYKLIMTGTPFTDNIGDYYNQIKFLSPSIIRSETYDDFEKRFLIVGGRSGNEIIGHKNLDYLVGLMEPYVIRIAAKDCLKLPEKVFYTEVASLSDAQEEVYGRIKNDLLKIIDDRPFSAAEILGFFTKLQQVACGYDPEQEEVIGTEKTKLLADICRNTNGPVVVFCKFQFEIGLVKSALQKEFPNEGISEFTGQNPKEREAEKDLFASGKNRFFVANQQAGSTGLNGLQIASTLVFFSDSFKYSLRTQSIGRIDRPGQKNQMFIYSLRTEAGIDDRIMNTLFRKSGLESEINELISDKKKLKEYIQNL